MQAIRYRLLLSLLVIGCIAPAKAQQFTRIFPVPPLEYPSTICTSAPITPTADGGYIINEAYGWPNWDVSGPQNTAIIKTDASFMPQWRHIINAPGGNQTFTYADSSTIIYYNSNGVKLEKINNAGQALWVKSYSRSSPYTMGIACAARRNNNIVLGGYLEQLDWNGWLASAAGLLLTVDTSGNPVTADSLALPGYSNYHIDALTTDAAGNTYIAGILPAVYGSFVAQVLPNNTIGWCHLFTDPNSFYEPTYNSMTVAANGDVLLAGYCYNVNVGSGATYITRVTTTGSLVWAKTIDRVSSAGSVRELPSGNILLTGNGRLAYSDTQRNVITMLNSSGDSVWARSYREGYAMGAPLLAGPDDWYFPAYTTNPILFNTDSLGNTLCPSAGFPAGFYNVALTVSTLNASLYPISFTPASIALDTVGTQSYVDSCSVTPTSIPSVATTPAVKIYPNPSTGSLTIEAPAKIEELTIWNSIGQAIYQEAPSGAVKTICLNKSGIYFVRIRYSGITVTNRITVL